MVSHYAPATKPEVTNWEWLVLAAVWKWRISIGVEFVGRLVYPLIVRHRMGVGVYNGPNAC